MGKKKYKGTTSSDKKLSEKEYIHVVNRIFSLIEENQYCLFDYTGSEFIIKIAWIHDNDDFLDPIKLKEWEISNPNMEPIYIDYEIKLKKLVKYDAIGFGIGAKDKQWEEHLFKVFKYRLFKNTKFIILNSGLTHRIIELNTFKALDGFNKSNMFYEKFRLKNMDKYMEDVLFYNRKKKIEKLKSKLVSKAG
jgi:hypothetical protein